MTPALFAGTSAVDEHTLMETPDGPELIRRHRETFITEERLRLDRRSRADPGPATGRATGPCAARPPYAAGRRAARRRRWTGRSAYGLKVLLDLHAVLGSQNGRDHSGRVGPRQLYPDRPAPRPTAWRRWPSWPRATPSTRRCGGIELVNEPTDPRIWRLWEFHHRAYRRLAEILVPGTRVVFSDGYVPGCSRHAPRPHPTFPVVMDSHLYQCFYPLGHPASPSSRTWLKRAASAGDG